MALEDITLRGFAEPDRAAVERAVIEAVKANPEAFLAAYNQNPQSFGGRYVCADLFKETFYQFNASPETRNRYNAPVHNSAAVLSAEAFRRALSDTSHPERDTAIFLTGTPGAGKTSIVLAAGQLPPEVRVLFEGQLSNPSSALPKIRQAIDAGLKPVVIAVHPLPEDALANTLKRFNEYGRGASINVMADIQGELPAGLATLRDHFGDAVALKITDVRDRLNHKSFSGWENLHVLASEGGREEIGARLRAALEQRRAAGTISDDGYHQALGRAPEQHRSVVATGSGREPPDGDRRNLSQRDREANLVGSASDYWAKTARKPTEGEPPAQSSAAAQTPDPTCKPRGPKLG